MDSCFSKDIVSAILDDWVLEFYHVAQCLQFAVRVLCTSNCGKRIDHALTVLITKLKTKAEAQEIIFGEDVYLYLNCSDDRCHRCSHTSKLINLCTFNMYSCLYVNCASIKLLKIILRVRLILQHLHCILVRAPEPEEQDELCFDSWPIDTVQ